MFVHLELPLQKQLNQLSEPPRADESLALVPAKPGEH